MKKYSIKFFILIHFFNSGLAQNEKDSRHEFYENEWQNWKTISENQTQIDIDTAIDIKFYHLDLEVAIDSHYVQGNIYVELEPTINNLNSINLNLHPSMQVDSITLDAISFTVNNDILTVNLSGGFNIGDIVGVKIYYHGVPALANGIKGLRYSTHGANEPIIATLSTPFLAHYWYPCKDGPQDKADSAFIDITIKDTIVNGFQLVAVSNGLLDEVDSTSGVRRTFRWKHRYPVVPYYIMMAISNYRSINQTYTGASSSFPLDYYVFNSSYGASLTGVAQVPDALDHFSALYGDYPFKNEKYGMTELGFYGAIENQTNTIINNMSTSYFNTIVHELAHQWFGDMITCKDWHHAWLNEGFASYSEALMHEYLNGFSVYKNYMVGFEYYSGGTIYLPSDTNAFNIFQSIIYDKGAYVLHMLRGVLGDAIFFNCLNTYTNSPQFRYSNAVTEDFKQVCETVSGQNLQYFFDQWIYDEYYPIYKYNFYSQPSNQLTALTIVQNQGITNGWRPVFTMPLQIRFNFSSGTDTLIPVWNDQQYQTWYFNFNDSVITVAIDPDKWVLKNASLDPTINVSVNELSGNTDYHVYPNPVRKYIIVEGNVSNDAKIIFSMFDFAGRMVYQNNFETVNSKLKAKIDLEKISKGVYFYEVKDKDDLIKKGKIVKE